MPSSSPPQDWPADLSDVPIHLIGAKGTGMCALAEILVAAGARVSGSDVDEEFYTDGILAGIGVPVRPFRSESLDAETALAVRSAAYDESNPVVAEAMKRGLPLWTYPEALGALSTRFDASAVAGVHGKTTTTALAGSLLKALEAPATVVVGSAVAGFGDRSTWSGGRDFLVAETCEYRRHFLHFHPGRIVLTSVESDHQDYYPDYASIRDAFVEFGERLPDGGTLIYCADDAGAVDVAERLLGERPDIRPMPYGEGAEGPWRVRFPVSTPGRNAFGVDRFDAEFHLAVPGRHIALDAVAALSLVDSLVDIDAGTAAAALAAFRGSRRRSEIIGETGDVLVMDDYAHHPTAISATLRGLKEFHPNRRLVVDFMPHTYSRTAALFDDFVGCFDDADLLALHPIYASARESNTASVSGRDLYKRIRDRRSGRPTRFYPTLDEAFREISTLLRPGDVFLTLGAGNNWPLGRRILEDRSA